MAGLEPFTLVSSEGRSDDSPQRLSTLYEQLTSSKVADLDIQLIVALREQYPDLTLTVVPERNVPLLVYAAAGYATATLDTEHETVLRWRGYVPAQKLGAPDGLGDATFFAFYHYKWGSEDFILYTVALGGNKLQYILKEPGPGESPLSHCAVTDELLFAVMRELLGNQNENVFVYDRYWSRDHALWQEVQRSSWNNVILSPDLKEELQDVAGKFFDSKEVYKRYGVPWKRGLIFHGPPGNGKTISLKALMKTLYDRPQPIVTLYVKSAPEVYNIQQVFAQARNYAPCLLVMEDIETIVTSRTRSYFFNEVDGLANNDGILMIASTNYLERLDPGLSQRPSRFDRKYLFPLPDEGERTSYATYWQHKLRGINPSLEFPDVLCPAFAKITHDFSFAYMQEAFVAALIILAKDETEDGKSTLLKSQDHRKTCAEDGGGDENLDRYKLWRVIKVEVANLRKQIGGNTACFDEIAASFSGMVFEQFPGCGRDRTSQVPPMHSSATHGAVRWDEAQSLSVPTRTALPSIRAEENIYADAGLGFHPLNPVGQIASGYDDLSSTIEPAAFGGRQSMAHNFQMGSDSRLTPLMNSITPENVMSGTKTSVHNLHTPISGVHETAEASESAVLAQGLNKIRYISEAAYNWRI